MKLITVALLLVVSFFYHSPAASQTNAPACIGFMAVRSDGRWYGAGSVDGIDGIVINLVYTARHEAIVFAAQQRGVTLLTVVAWEQQYAAFLQ